jgi:valyl-tRNA synthetase
VVTEEYGTDAVRMALLSGAAPGTDIVFTVERIAGARAFANKIWNAARFIFMNVEVGEAIPPFPAQVTSLEDRWIWSRLNQCAREMNQAIDHYRYHEAAQTIWHFIYDDFCDWYIELKKISGDWGNILSVFETTMRLLHPAMPFLTEELWHRLGAPEQESISLQPYPQYDEARYDAEAEGQIEVLQDVVRAARNLRADLGLDPKQPLQGRISIPVDVETIRRLSGVTFERATVPKTGAVRSTPHFDLSIDVPTGQIEAQRRRLEKERDQLVKNVANSQRQLSDEVFMSKAPAHVVDTMRAKLLEYEAQLKKIEESLNAS